MTQQTTKLPLLTSWVSLLRCAFSLYLSLSFSASPDWVGKSVLYIWIVHLFPSYVLCLSLCRLSSITISTSVRTLRMREINLTQSYINAAYGYQYQSYKVPHRASMTFTRVPRNTVSTSAQNLCEIITETKASESHHLTQKTINP